LLDSPELDRKNLSGLDYLAFSDKVDSSPLKVLGYPLGIQLIPTMDLILRNPGLVELRTLLEASAEKPVEDRGSPFYKAMMLSIQGKFLPGHSGAPVLDSNNRVIAIANGGLRGGLADISWAVPINSLEMDPKADKENLLYKLKNSKPDTVFMFTPASPVWTPPPYELSDEDKNTFDSLLDAIDRQSFSRFDDLLDSSLLPDMKTPDYQKVERVASRAWPQYRNKRSRLQGAVWTWFLELPGYYRSELGATPDETNNTQAVIQYDVDLVKQFSSLGDATAYARALIAYANAKQFHGTVKEYKHGENVAVSTELRNAPMDCALEIFSTEKGFATYFLYKKVRVNVQ
jgi:hypothetical protein